MATNRNQHVIPQFYLKHFASEGQLLTLDIRTRTTFKSSVKSSGFERDYYNVQPPLLPYYFENLDGNIDEQYVDQILSKYFENQVAPYLRKLDKLGNSLKTDDKEVRIKPRLLERFFLIQFFRSWKFREEFKPIAEMVRDMCARKKFIPKILTLSRLENDIHGIFLMFVLSRLGFGPNLQLKQHVQNSFSEILDKIENLRRAISLSKKSILVSRSNEEFATSDNPAVVMWKDEKANHREFSFAYLPLTKKMGAIFTCNDPRFSSNQVLLIDDSDEFERIKNLNCLLANKVSRFIYAPNPSLIQYLIDYINGVFPISLRL